MVERKDIGTTQKDTGMVEDSVKYCMACRSSRNVYNTVHETV